MWAKKIINLLSIFKNAYERFKSNKPLRMASSTAYFAIFALPPILIILINLLGSFLTEEIVSGELFSELNESFGTEGTAQLQTIFYNLQQREGNWLFTLGGTVLLFFISTTLFLIVQGYIDELWDIKPRKSGIGTEFMLIFKQRLKSLGIILFSGILVLSSLVSDTLLYLLGAYLAKIIPQYDFDILHIASHLLSIVIQTIWFAVLFKYLPSMRIAWRAVFAGAIVTGIMFESGKVILAKLLVNSGVTSVYGAAGSFVLLLLFIFYSSMILFYGASFTKTFAEYTGTYMAPKAHAMQYEIKELFQNEAGSREHTRKPARNKRFS
jgi:membrane protein